MEKEILHELRACTICKTKIRISITILKSRSKLKIKFLTADQIFSADKENFFAVSFLAIRINVLFHQPILVVDESAKIYLLTFCNEYQTFW